MLAELIEEPRTDDTPPLAMDDEVNEKNQDDDLLLVPSPQQQQLPPPKRRIMTMMPSNAPPKSLAKFRNLVREHRHRLEVASIQLIDTLFCYLRNLPTQDGVPPPNEEATSITRPKNNSSSPNRGLTLPASAIGWLASQLYPDVAHQTLDEQLLQQQQPQQYQHYSPLCMGASVKDRVALLKYLLPRATHVRVTAEEWPPPLQPKEETHNRYFRDEHDFVGRDVSLSAVSVHSGVTMDTLSNQQHYYGAHASFMLDQSFLIRFQRLVQRPSVDMQVFPNCRVLFLEQVPPEWVVNLSFVAEHLELLRTQRGCIFDVNKLFFSTTNAMTADSLSCSDNFTKLSHLKMTHSGLGELSGLRGKQCNDTADLDPLGGEQQSRPPLPPPFSKMPNLISLSLAHNEIRSARTALAGLSACSHLRKLDLSHNYISTLKGAHLMLGNLHTLDLTGNRLKNVAGLDRLYSLHQLFLGHNQLADVHTVAPLGNLPELTHLHLHHNPLVKKDKRGYRVKVLNVFKEARLGSSLILARATYRQLLKILPILDGESASKKELIGLRGLTFGQTVPRPQQIAPAATSDASPDEDWVISGRDGDSGIVATPSKPRQQQRRRRRRRVVLDQEETSSPNAKAIAGSKKMKLPKIEFTAHDVVQRLESSLSAEKAKKEKEKLQLQESQASLEEPKPLPLRKELVSQNSFVSCHSEDNLLVAALRAHDERKRELSTQEQQSDEEHKVDETKPEIKPPKTIKLSVAPGSSRSFIFIPPSAVEDNKNDDDDNNKTSTAATSDLTGDHQESTDGEDETGSSSKENGEPIDLQKRNRSSFSSQKPTKSSVSARLLSLVNSLDDEKVSVSSKMTPRHEEDPAEPVLPDNIVVVSSTANETRSKSSDTNPFVDSDLADQQQSLSYGTSVAFPDLLGGSSLGTPNPIVEEDPNQDHYHLEEKNSIYDGNDGYKHLNVLANLELYFRCFVFPTNTPEIPRNLIHLEKEKQTQLIMEACPRIQLRPIDRLVAENSLKEKLHQAYQFKSIKESFRRVWRESVLACGKSASRRVKPQKTPRRGFHGDILFSNGKLEKVCDCRKLILCTSDAALYVIIDHDNLATTAATTTTTTTATAANPTNFPMPIPQEALFLNAPWPHAVARHPLNSLERITIGFGFQRLTLHFSASSEAEKKTLGDQVTYILMTSNKVRTVSLLRHLQEMAREASGRNEHEFDDDENGAAPLVQIDNDDKQFLDSLASAVEPNSIGTILHYQILQQRWKHGDRGAVRRACVLTESHLYLLDEDYVGDGSESLEDASSLGDVKFRVVDATHLSLISEVQAAVVDPRVITLVVKPTSMLQRVHNWRLVCVDGDGAEKLVDAVRNAMEMAEAPEDASTSYYFTTR